MAFEPFVDAYGKPEDGTAATARQLESAPAVVQPIVDAGLAGIYDDGVLSLLSKREADGDLGPWGAFLPKGARLFGTSACGTVFAADDERIWLVDTQYGQVVESPDDAEGFLERVADPEAREHAFHEPLFRQWVEINGALGHKDVLSPTPALPLGGDWRIENLRSANLEVYLSLTGQLFGPGTGMEIEYRD